jgi:TM2 domain-containing membrane protein YozV
MSKVIKIENEIVSIGMDSGQIKEVRMFDLNFTPSIGDEVEVFENETNIIVTKKEKIQSQKSEGININLNNTLNVPTGQVVGATSKAVNKVVYCILALFLGGLGVHKFYAGKTGKGIVYLIFCWTYIPAIIALFEFFGALFKKADSAGNIVV